MSWTVVEKEGQEGSAVATAAEKKVSDKAILRWAIGGFMRKSFLNKEPLRTYSAERKASLIKLSKMKRSARRKVGF